MRATQLLTSNSPDPKVSALHSSGLVPRLSELSNTQLTDTQHIANVGSWEWDALTDKTSWSDELFRIFGVQPQEFGATYEAFLDRVHPDDREMVERTIELAIQDKSFHKFENRIIRPDGTIRGLRTELKVIVDESGGVIRLSGTAQDITQTQLAERALQESEARYRMLIETLPVIVYSFQADPPYTAIYVSSNIESLGYSVDEWYTTPHLWIRLLHPDDSERILEETRVARAAGAETKSEYRVVAKDGSVVWLQDRGQFGSDASGKRVRQGVILDITERKHSEDKVRGSEERHRQLFESNPQPMWVFELATLQFLAVNEAALLHYGFSREEFLGMTIKDIRPREDVPELLDNLAKTGSFPGNAQVRHKKRDGQMIDVEILSNPIFFDGKDARLVLANDLTARRQIDLKLRESEEKHRTILERIEDGYFEVDLAGNFTFFNDSLCTIFGYSAKEMMGMNFRHYTVPEAVPKIARTFNNIYQSGESSREYGYRIFKKDGTLRYVETSATLMRNTSGERIGFLGILRDITERKLAEEALRRSEERYRTIIEAMNDAYWEMDLGGRFTYFNNQLTKLNGRTAEELQGLSYKTYMDTEAAERSWRFYNQLYRTGEPIKGLVHAQYRGDGTLNFVESNVSMIRDPDGEPIGFRGISRDITDRMHTEEALRQSEERYRNIIEEMTDGSWEVDLDGNYTFLNNQMLKFHRRSREELMGLNNREYMNEETATRVAKAFKDVYLTGEPARDLSFEMIRGDRTTWINESSVSLIRDQEGKPIGFRGVDRDITARKQVELELQWAKETAEAASRSKSEFLANMSHEIRTPMNGIIGMTKLTLDTDLSAEQREFLGMVKTSASSLMTVINDILDFSKIEAGKLDFDATDFSLRDCLGDAVKSLAVRAHEKNLELSVDIATDVPDALIGDAGRLRQVIVNLAGNAIKFTDTGEVIVRIKTRAISGDEIHLHVAVTDTGIGIPEKKQKVIFDAFTQADGSTTRKYGGTGLGLAISSQLVSMMGGTLVVESAPDEGSTFHFTARLGLQPTSTQPRAPSPALDVRGLRVLVVDDNGTNRRVLQQMLLNWKMKATIVDGGEAALAAMTLSHQAGRPFRLVLLDAHMPEMDGFEVAEKIRQNPALARVPIMMMTSNDQRGDAERCRKLGVASTITKPITQSIVLDAIMASLGATVTNKEPSAPAVDIAASEDSTGLHILLAEDNIINQKLAVHLLKKNGHTVVIAANGVATIAAFEKEKFDLLLMDIQMPAMNGFEATAIIREREKASSSHIPIIALTAHAMKGDRERCLAAGMDGYISKPIQVDELSRVINSVIGKTRTTMVEQIEIVPGRMKLDYPALLAQVGGDLELLREIVSLFVEDYPHGVAEIRDAIANEDGGSLEHAAHALRGAISNFHAKSAVETALRLEEMGRSGNMSQAGEALSLLETDLASLKLSLADVLDR